MGGKMCPVMKGMMNQKDNAAAEEVIKDAGEKSGHEGHH